MAPAHGATLIALRLLQPFEDAALVKVVAASQSTPLGLVGVISLACVAASQTNDAFIRWRCFGCRHQGGEFGDMRLFDARCRVHDSCEHVHHNLNHAASLQQLEGPAFAHESWLHLEGWCEGYKQEVGGKGLLQRKDKVCEASERFKDIAAFALRATDIEGDSSNNLKEHHQSEQHIKVAQGLVGQGEVVAGGRGGQERANDCDGETAEKAFLENTAAQWKEKQA
jgi:hypothetical protein